ncbi:uncharacterized protein LOC113357815 isoform X2 [Papaver somniferum]|uniref:uncharacterized protein LOC113357815 isoform X2 n=1 Tax=Papaver somniferum TaxID=3469 RepID=UPI000E6FCF2C|nr:uncharacterized protein LOC113357815 isoform X2 [Papaver somniferum]
MAAAGELVEYDDPEIRLLGQQQIESDGGQGRNTDVLDGYKELHKAAIKGHWDMARMFLKKKKNKASEDPSPSFDPLHKPALASTSSTLLTPEEDTITTTAASDNLTANMERPSTVYDNQEITQVINDDHNDQVEESAEDGGQVMSTDVLDGYKELHKAAATKGRWDMARILFLMRKKNKPSQDPSPSFDPLHKLAEDGGQVMNTDVLDGYKEVYEAATKGDWHTASKFLEKNPEAVTKVITSDSRTVLHVAICTGNLVFTKEIVKLMPPEVLEYKTSITGATALHYAAVCGYAKAARVLVNKNSKLIQIEDRFKRIPLHLALISATGRQRGTVEYLYSETRHHHPSHFSGNQGDSMLRHSIDAGYYGIASSIVQRFPELVIDHTNKVQTNAMNNMAERPFSFASGAKHTFLQRRIYSLIKVEVTNEDEENLGKYPPENSEDMEENDGILELENIIFPGVTVHDIIVGASALSGAIIHVPICIILGLIYFMLIHGFLVFLRRFIIPSSPVVKVEKNSDESLPQSLEGTNGDEENLVKTTEESYEDQINPPENSENTAGEKTKGIDIKDTIIYMHVYISAPIYVLFYLIYLLIKFSVRFICSPVSHIKQTYKQVYEEKVNHKEAEALVKIMLTTLKERMNRVEVVDFFGRSNFMKMAISHRNVEIVQVCIKLFPYLIWTQLAGQNMIQMAIAERNETILNIICEESGKSKIDLVSRCDDEDNTILHYAAKLAPSAQLNSVSGAYLQMQREKQWFKGVENMIPEKDRFKRNKNGDTAHDIFTKEHKELKESGERWLKDTAGSCMLVAALIATVSFASVFTVPGGNFSENNSGKIGTPVFLREISFTVFAIADAFALLSAITSVLMFLAIYTSRYAEVDFLKSLPNKLILGLTTLFISMASVLVGFGASLFIVLGDRYRWVLIPIVVVSCVPVTLFGWLQLPLFVDMIRSTYWGSLFREHTYISSLQLYSKKEYHENHYNKLPTFVEGFVPKRFQPLPTYR